MLNSTLIERVAIVKRQKVLWYKYLLLSNMTIEKYSWTYFNTCRVFYQRDITQVFVDKDNLLNYCRVFEVLQFVTVCKNVIVVIAFRYKYIIFVQLINVNDMLYLKNQSKLEYCKIIIYNNMHYAYVYCRINFDETDCVWIKLSLYIL